MKKASRQSNGMGKTTGAIFLAVTLLLSNPSLALACGPDFTGALMVNGNHPDLPLKLFAQGNLGVIQPSWAQSYLLVSYRYLSGLPLDKQEQTSMLRLWHSRLATMQGFYQSPEDEPVSNYFKLRARVLGQKIQANSSRWDFTYANIVSDNAFANALKNLQVLVKTYGEKSPQAKEWVKAQDLVFGANKDSHQSIPPMAATNSDAAMNAQRAYQIAAATFYANDLEKAKSLFEKLAQTGGPYWRDLAWYMAARSAVNAAFNTGDTASEESAKKYIAGILKTASASPYKDDLVDLYEWMANLIAPPDANTAQLIKSILSAHNDKLGHDVDSLTSLLDASLPNYLGLNEPGQANTESKESSNEDKSTPAIKPIDCTKYELTDWIANIQEPDIGWWGEEEKTKWEKLKTAKAKHALARWRETHSDAWFVAALYRNKLTDKSNQDLLAACSKVTQKSASYLTARFYLGNSLIESGKFDEARKLAQEILALKNLPPGSRNMFMSQNLACANNIAQIQKLVVQRPVSVSVELDSTKLPPKWNEIEKQNSYYSADAVTSNILADDINSNLPQARWNSWALDRTVPKSVHSEIVRAAWLRSKILGMENNVLDDELLKCYPIMKKEMDRYHAASGQEKSFALASFILKYEGMSPYLQGGVVRHGDKINELDYFKANFWLPYNCEQPAKIVLPEDAYSPPWQEAFVWNLCPSTKELLNSYNKPVIRSLLSKQELKQVDTERKILFENPPARFLGDRILAWAKTNPKDPGLPEVLYRLLKLPRWSFASALGTKYSRQAYLVLHKQYPKNSWTQKAVCWY